MSARERRAATRLLWTLGIGAASTLVTALIDTLQRGGAIDWRIIGVAVLTAVLTALGAGLKKWMTWYAEEPAPLPDPKSEPL